MSRQNARNTGGCNIKNIWECAGEDWRLADPAGFFSRWPLCPADEIDAIAPKRETAQREMERRIVAQMLTCLDDLSGSFMAAQGNEPAAEAGQQGGGSDEEGRQAREDARRLLEGKHVVVIGR